MRVTVFLLRLFSCYVVDVYSQTFPYLSLMGQILAEHSYVNSSDVQGDTYLQCFTDLFTCCSASQGPYRGNWYFPDGSALPFTGTTYQIRSAQRVDLRRVGTVDSPSGIYVCRAPTNSDSFARIYVGVYASGGNVNVSEIRASEVTYLNDGSPQFTLSCISTGGPTTTVVWARDSVIITEGSFETVLNDAETAQYTHTLTLTGRLPGLYTCTVSNNKPSTSTASIKLNSGLAPISTQTMRKSSTSLLVSWALGPVWDTTGYVIFYPELGSSALSQNVTVGGACTTSYTLSGVSNGALAIAGVSYFLSDSMTFAMMAPYLSVESVDTSSVVLSWTNGGSSSVAYTLEWRLSSATCIQYNAAVDNGNTVHRVTGLEAGTEYVFNVIAIDGNSTSRAISNPVTVSTAGEATDTQGEQTQYYGEGFYLEICLNGLFSCPEWVVHFVEEKIQDISSDISISLSESISIDLMLTNETLICLSDSPNSVLFNSTVRSNGNISDILTDIKSWALKNPTLSVLGVLMIIEMGCGSISGNLSSSSYTISQTSSVIYPIPTLVKPSNSITYEEDLLPYSSPLDHTIIEECNCGELNLGDMGLSIGVGAGIAVAVILIALAAVLIPFCGLKWQRGKMRSFPLTSDVTFVGVTVPNIAYNSSFQRERVLSADITYDVVDNQASTNSVPPRPIQMAELAENSTSSDGYENNTPPHIRQARKL